MSGGGSAGASEALPLSVEHFFLAVFVGLLASASLTLGSLTGVLLQPNSAKTGVLYSFGAGALFAALSVVLVAPTVANVTDPLYLEVHGKLEAQVSLVVLAVLSLVGGAVFILLDEVFSNRGSEIRKMLKTVRNTKLSGGAGGRTTHPERLFGSSSFFQLMSMERRQELAKHMRYVCYHVNDVVFGQGESATRLWIVKSGDVELQMRPGEGFHVSGRGELLGGVAFLTGEPQIMSAVAASDVEAYCVDFASFARLIEGEPTLKVALMVDVAELLQRISSANQRGYSDRNEVLEQWQAKLGLLAAKLQKDIPAGDIQLDPPIISEAPNNSFSRREALGEDADISALEQCLGVQSNPQPKQRSQVDAHSAPLPAAHPTPLPMKPSQASLAAPDRTGHGSQRRGTVKGHMMNDLSSGITRFFSSGFSMVSEAMGGSESSAVFIQEVARASSRDTSRLQTPRPSESGGVLPLELMLSTLPRTEEEGEALQGAPCGAIPEQPEVNNANSGETYECPITGQSILLEVEDIDVDTMEGITRSMRSLSDDRELSAKAATLFMAQGGEWASSDAPTSGPAPMAVWVGNLMDGVAEAIVIGAQVSSLLASQAAAGDSFSLANYIPYTLIAGLCIANFPEAMAASMTMYQYGWSKPRVVLMWFSLTATIALGSGVGYALAAVLPHLVVVGVEGFAAGGMLVMIASAMVPEAVHLCGPNMAGMWLLAGFTVSYLFELLQV